MSDFETVSVDQVPADALILDVREEYEFAEGHAPGAIHIPLGELPVRYEELDPDNDTYIICRTGGRNVQAAAWLVSQGYSVFSIGGGYGSWIEAGRELASENGQEPNVR